MGINEEDKEHLKEVMNEIMKHDFLYGRFAYETIRDGDKIRFRVLTQEEIDKLEDEEE